MRFRVGDKIKVKPGVTLTTEDIELGLQHDTEYEVDASFQVLGFSIIGIKGISGSFKPNFFVRIKEDMFILCEIDE